MRPRERQLLWLAHAEGYSHREIAEVTGLGSASIRLLLFRARRKIARLLQNPPTRPAPNPSASRDQAANSSQSAATHRSTP
jgi:DNA-directed RNA polymerase specialized sigma24 family protein